MSYLIGYFVKATEEVYSAVREALPEGCELVGLPEAEGRLKEIDVLIAPKVTRQMILSAPSLKLIQTPGVGYDGIDLEAAAERGIPVAYTICGNTDEVAEHTMLLMLAVSRRLIEIDQAIRSGRWLMWERRLQSRNLRGRMLGLVGFGRIGREVARRAEAFGMKVQYSDPAVPSGEGQTPLDTLIATSDYVSIHVPLTAGTRGLIGPERIARMKPGSILINTSRGEIIDESALIEALREGRIAGAGLDVFTQEPPALSNPLLAMANVVLTPHVASGTVDGLRAKAAWYARNIERIRSGEQPLDLVPVMAGAPK